MFFMGELKIEWFQQLSRIENGTSNFTWTIIQKCCHICPTDAHYILTIIFFLSQSHVFWCLHIILESFLLCMLKVQINEMETVVQVVVTRI